MGIKLAVFMGGDSVEHEISIISAVQAISFLDISKYDIYPIYISKNNEMYYSENFKDINTFKNIKSAVDNSVKINIRREGDKVFAFDSNGGLFRKKPVFEIDFALPVVHGTNCEDGTLQGYLEMLGLPYAGCDMTSSAVGMDKAIFKYVLEANHISVLPMVTFGSREWIENEEEISDSIGKLGYPVIVKPANLGSSVGIKVIKSPEELKSAVENAASYAEKILVEHAVENLREFNCSVIGDASYAKASAVDEPFMTEEILSYNDKYISSGKGMSGLKRKLPADIPEEKTKEIQQMSVNTFKACGCAGVVRVDFLMDCNDNDRLYVNEINTIPGSLAFYLWKAVGLEYRDMLDEIIEQGFKRFRNKQNLNFSYDTEILSSCGGLGAKGFKKG
ncbi:MAG: D-alanine--D-alanine ligase family protein [Acutalibacteraceae bacterium]